MCWKLLRCGIEGHAILRLDIHDGGCERLSDGLRDDGANLRVHVPLVHEALERPLEGGQVKVPVLHRAKLRCRARELRDGRDELLGVKLVAKVALVGVGLLALAATHGAMAHDLAPVQELARLCVKELAGTHSVQVSALVETCDDLCREPLVDVFGRLEA